MGKVHLLGDTTHSRAFLEIAIKHGFQPNSDTLQRAINHGDMWCIKYIHDRLYSLANKCTPGRYTVRVSTVDSPKYLRALKYCLSINCAVNGSFINRAINNDRPKIIKVLIDHGIGISPHQMELIIKYNRFECALHFAGEQRATFKHICDKSGIINDVTLSA